MQHEILNEIPLLDKNGDLTEAGFAKKLLPVYRRADSKASPMRIKNFAEIICHTINFSNFVLGDHSDFCLYFFVFQHYKVTTNFANHQVYKHL